MGRTKQQTAHDEPTDCKTVEIDSPVVADVIARWPQTIPVFLRNRLACVGCPLSQFERVRDVAEVYHLDLHHFLRELRDAILKREWPARTSDGETRNEG